MWKLSGVVLGAVLLTVGCGGAKDKVPVSGNEDTVVSQEGTAEPQIVTPIINTDGDKIGKATLKQEDGGVSIKVKASGLEPGKHGIHIHEHGVCTAPDFKASAGGHFNPTNKEHGFDNPKGYHAGDLENIEVDEEGKVKARITTDQVTLHSGRDNSLLDNDGSALVIHEGVDDYKTDPAGDSGKPFACAEITMDQLK
ncbi:superoxide dismutase family protein [Sporosarcina obsidiansis]|uniref:superoxide dismutase family protein n=1 Tax=Sporosarcina obsidiansis TaxID=2660748 RepID=UPI00129BF72A|nr:superoxide dismutase family protein [Sporosarcina obsidiansis]